MIQLKRQEATYFWNNDNSGHFAFNCRCGSRLGVDIDSGDHELKRKAEDERDYLRKQIFMYTAYFSHHILLGLIEDSSRTERGSLTLVCRDKNCRNRLSFTPESYLRLTQEIIAEGTPV